MSEPNRDDLAATPARASDLEHEGSPYRDDLEAAQARVNNLEREAEALRKRNAELERPAPPPQPAADPAPEPTRFAAAMTSATKYSLFIALFAGAGSTRSTSHREPNPTLGLIFLGIAFVCWCCSGFRRPWA